MNLEPQTLDIDLNNPCIYVACLASYNAGTLHGVWIDATEDVDDIYQQINAMLRASPEPDCEEWAIHDYQNFEGVEIQEYDSIESVCELAQFVVDHGKLGAMVLEYYGSDLKEAEAAFERYAGSYENLAAFAEELTDTTGISDYLLMYLDFAAIGRDMELSGDILSFEIGYGTVHIFWSH